MNAICTKKLPLEKYKETCPALSAKAQKKNGSGSARRVSSLSLLGCLFSVLCLFKTLGSFRSLSPLLVIDPFHCGSIAERTGPLLSSETSVQTVGSAKAPTPAP